MSLSTFCLSILPAVATSITPTAVDKIVKTHIVEEYTKQNPNAAVNFDHKGCENVVYYKESPSSLSIEGQTRGWQGKKEISYTAALAQRPIDFSLQTQTPPIIFERRKTSFKKWVLVGAAAVLGIGLGAYYLNKSSQGQPQATNNAGLSF